MAIYHVINGGDVVAVTRDKAQALQAHAEHEGSVVWRERLGVLDAPDTKSMGHVAVRCGECGNVKSVSAADFVAAHRVWGTYRCEWCTKIAAGESFYEALELAHLPTG